MPNAAQSYKPDHPRTRDPRPSSCERGYDARWQRYRAWYLQQPENVMCRNCEREAATVVDHILPHKGDEKLFWDESNHQPLCKCCHDTKTATQDGGFGR